MSGIVHRTENGERGCMHWEKEGMEKNHKDEPVGVLTGGNEVTNEGSLDLK